MFIYNESKGIANALYLIFNMIVSVIVFYIFYVTAGHESSYFSLILLYLINSEILISYFIEKYNDISSLIYNKYELIKVLFIHSLFSFIIYIVILSLFKREYNLSQLKMIYICIFTIKIFISMIYVQYIEHFKKRKKIILVSDTEFENINDEYDIRGVYFIDKVFEKVNLKLGNIKNNEVVKLSDRESVKNFIKENEINSVVIVIANRMLLISENYNEILKIILEYGIITKLNLKFLNDYGFNDIEFEKGNLDYITFSKKRINFIDCIVKRIIDLLISIVGIFIMIILIILFTPIIKMQSPGPIFFKQKRVGKNGKIFYIYKFRTMKVNAENELDKIMGKNEINSDLMFKIKDDPRIYPFGKFLRASSLDEFPQFINVFMGSMSVVGTRPPTYDEWCKYELHHFKRLLIKPGITGLWQVSGRNSIVDFEEVLKLDIKYIENWSLRDDLKIILKTIISMLSMSGR